MIKKISLNENGKAHPSGKIDRATGPDWMGISDDVLKKMIAKGIIKDKLPPDLMGSLGI